MTDTAPNFVDWLNARFIQQGAEVEFRHDGHSIAAHGFGVALGSAFQPIIGGVTGRTLGWEGLVRPRNLAGLPLPLRCGVAAADHRQTGAMPKWLRPRCQKSRCTEQIQQGRRVFSLQQ